MRDGEGSSTALGVSVIRTVHQIVDDSPHILEDTVSQLLLDDATVGQIQRGSERFRSDEARGLRSHIVLRSRYAEDELHEVDLPRFCGHPFTLQIAAASLLRTQSA